MVHPTEFVVHIPHKESAARLMMIDPANAALRDKVLTAENSAKCE